MKGINVLARAKELKPVREEFLRRLKEDHSLNVSKAAKELGVSPDTAYSWKHKAKEPEKGMKGARGRRHPKMEIGVELFRQDPSLGIHEALAKLGIPDEKRNIWLVEKWRRRARKAREVATQIPAVLSPHVKPDWEQILKACPDTEILGALLLEGFMKKLDERDSAYVVLKNECLKLQDTINEQKRQLDEDRRYIHQLELDNQELREEYNQLLTKKKNVRMGIDKVEHKLFRKV